MLSSADVIAQARLALRRERPAVSFADLSPWTVLLATQSPRELGLLVTASLGPLLGDDGEAPELLRTLDAYLECGGLVAATADRLGVHRHTVRHRLARIGAALGKDVTAAEHRAELTLAVTARALLR